jgi:O-methyltransferase
VHIDVDIYQSVSDCCAFFYPRMLAGAIMILDDYGFVTCPGVKPAVDAFLADKPETPVYLPTGQCMIVRI